VISIDGWSVPQRLPCRGRCLRRLSQWWWAVVRPRDSECGRHPATNAVRRKP